MVQVVVNVMLLLMAAGIGFILLGIMLRKDHGAIARRVAPACWAALAGFLITKLDTFLAAPFDKVVLMIGMAVVLAGIGYGCWMVVRGEARPVTNRDG